MSLAVLADHMASKGRGPDSMLIHMSPREVQGLQALAMKNGGSLTINPETGLPEAGVLDKLLPAIIGAGVSYFSGGTINPAMIGLGVGAFESVRTGDLGRGISAGLGAYGGAGLGESFANAGVNELTNAGVGNYAETLASQGIYPTLESGAVNPAYGEAASKLALESQKNALASPFANKMSAGFDAAKANPSSLLTKDNLKYGFSAISPVLADQAVKSNMPTTTTRPGQMSTYSFDPYVQRYTSTGNYQVPRKTEAAGGGLMGMNDGGYSPGQLNFAERSEPVVRMARGGVPGYAGIDGSLVGAAPAPPPQNVEELYTSILGRPSDTEGAKYWGQQFGNTIDQSEVDNFRKAANIEIANRQAAGAGAAGAGAAGAATTGGAATATSLPQVTPTTAGLNTLYQENLYRAPDEGGLAYWSKQFGDTIDDKERATFMQAAKPEQQVGDIYRNVLGRDPDASGLAYWTSQINAGMPPSKVYESLLTSAKQNAENVAANTNYDSATKAYTGYRSTDQVNAADEWVRNTLGRDPTPEDRKQSWYQDAAKALSIGSTNTAYGQFQDYAKTNVAATTAQKIKDATASLAARGLTDADVKAQTGKTIAELAASDIDLNKGLAAASQLRPLGTKAGFDFGGIKKAPAKALLLTSPKTNAAAGTTNLYGNATNPGDITRNADGSTTVTPNIPGRPYGGFAGIDEVKNAYTAGGGSLGYTSPVIKTMDEFNAKYNKATGGSKQAYDYLTGKTKYIAAPFTDTGEVMKPYAESVLGVAPNITAKKVLFDPVTRTYKTNPDYIPVTYTPEGKKVIGKSDREVADALAAATAATTKKATGGLLSLAGGGMPGYSGESGSVVKDNTANFANWVKVNNISMEQVARALGITVAEAEKKYGTKDDAKAADTSGFKGYKGYGENASNDPSVDSNPGWSGKTDAEKAAYYGENPTMAGVTRGLQAAFSYSWPSVLQNFFDPDRVAREGLIAAGVDPAVAANNVEAGRAVAAENEAVAAQAAEAKGLSVADSVGGSSMTGGPPGVAGSNATTAEADNSGNTTGETASDYGGTGGSMLAYGGLTALAQGGMYNLGGYSDGGRLLRGPGDGVSDSIPAMIGKKQPARLADGEFVVPARIVSELGNGSTEAGARKLYAMMDRIQAARRSSIGKGKVAKNSRADKYLPA